jgi:hypothetical protein
LVTLGSEAVVGLPIVVALVLILASIADDARAQTITSKSRSAIVKTIKSAKKQLGKPYRWGGGHGDSGRYGFDCSGLASYVARRAGYRGPTVTTYSAWRYSRPVRKGDWLKWGIKPGHMAVSVYGVIYEAARSGVPIRLGVDRGYVWRTPYGIVPLRRVKSIKIAQRKGI